MRRRCTHGTQRGSGDRCKNATNDGAVYCPTHGGPTGDPHPREVCPSCGRNVARNPATGELRSHVERRDGPLCVGQPEFEPEPYDLADVLGEFGALIMPSEAIPPGEVWTGPTGTTVDEAIAMFGPGTTAGGRAEAGWMMVGTIDADALKLGDPHREPGDWPAGPAPTTEGIQR